MWSKQQLQHVFVVRTLACSACILLCRGTAQTEHDVPRRVTEVSNCIITMVHVDGRALAALHNYMCASKLCASPPCVQVVCFKAHKTLWWQTAVRL